MPVRKVFLMFLGFCLLSAFSPAFSEETSSPDLEKILGVKFFGDIRFRTEYFVQDQDYSPTHVSTPVQWIDHELRFRFRGKLGVEKSFADQAKATFGIITAGGPDPSDPNWTASGGGSFKGIGLNLASIAWTPTFLNRQVTLTLGKMANPLTFSPITWDEDITPEGAALVFEPAQNTRFTALYFVLQENGPATIEGNGVDLFLTHFQLQQKFKALDSDISLTAGYQYMANVTAFATGSPGMATYISDPTNPPGAPLSVTAKGMVGDMSQGWLIPDIHLVEGILKADSSLGDEKIRLQLILHGAVNLTSFNITALTDANTAVNNPTSNASNNLALFARAQAGGMDHRGQWLGSLEWGYIEPNAVFAAFSDSDSGEGHNNNTWLKGKIGLGLEEGFSLSVAQYMDWRVNYDVMATAPSNVQGTTSRSPVMRTQIDMAVKF